MNYNGWPNYETWCAFSWLSNDSKIYNDIGRFIDKKSLYCRRVEDIVYSLSLALKSDYEYIHNPLVDEANMYSDLLNSSLQEIDWLRISENFVESLKEKI